MKTLVIIICSIFALIFTNNLITIIKNSKEINNEDSIKVIDNNSSSLANIDNNKTESNINSNSAKLVDGVNYIDSEGIIYLVYSTICSKGKNKGNTIYYIYKVSKNTNKPYKYYIKEEKLIKNAK